MNDNGVLLVFDAATGDEIYKARVGGSGNTFSASPWAVGRARLLPERGRVHVRASKPAISYVEIAKNSLGEMSLATPALAPDALFLRTQTKLYRIGKG